VRSWEATRFRVKVWPRGDCWEWRGARDKDGYGLFKSAEGIMVRAHRAAFEMAKGPIPNGLQLDHLCRHRWCVRPSHLEAVTCAVNIRRGETGRAQSRRTHCPRGHERTPENLVRRGRKHTCRLCLPIYQRRAYDRRKRLGLPLNGKQYRVIT